MFSSCNRIRIVWVSAFIELVEGKEVAGESARRGAETLLYGPEYFCGIGKRGVHSNDIQKRRTAKEIMLGEVTRNATVEPMCLQDCLILAKKKFLG